jgi:bifunctional DNA-binding transcriptional regulator/antitoxin component of YhaV-PrlF toxin-antitoxin module
MGMTKTLQVRSKGNLTLPAEIRRKYQISDGTVMTLVDLGDGYLMLMPTVSLSARLGDEISHILNEKGVTEEELLHILEEERQKYYTEHYGQA